MKLSTELKANKSYSIKDDFYKYVNHQWLAAHRLPDTESRWGSFDVLRDKTLKQLLAICKTAMLDKKAPKGSNNQIIGDFFATGMDLKKRDQDGIIPIAVFLDQIDAIKNTDQIIPILAKLNLIKIFPFFSLDFDKDVKNPDKAAMYVSQGGLGMPNREYYLDKSEDMQKIREEYIKYMTQLFKLAGYKNNEAVEAAKTVFDIELKLSVVSRPKELVRELDKNYEKYTVVKAKKQFAIFRQNYLELVGGKHLKDYIIQQPEFLTEVEQIFKGDLNAIKLYLKWNLLNEASPFLSHKFINARFNFFGKALQGLKKQKPLGKRVIQIMQGSYGTPLTEALGPIYIKKHFSPAAKAILYQMVDEIKEAFKERVKKLDWMDEKTKKLVYKKVDRIRFKLAYPDKWEDISKIGIDRGSFVLNYFKMQSYEFKKKMNEAGGPANWDEWVMKATIVNACADQMREMTFPAAFFQGAFFNPKADMATNFGSAGSVMGHELSHFVDDQGSKYDASGRLNEWWPQKVRKAYQKGSKAFVDHYNRFSVEDVPVNGEFTQGENIGDVAGLMIAYDALQKYIDKSGDNKVINGLTPEQRFFIGYARTECGHKRLEYRKMAYKTDPHAPGEVRVNAALSIIPEFIKAFDIKEGDNMYVPPETYPKLW